MSKNYFLVGFFLILFVASCKENSSMELRNLYSVSSSQKSINDSIIIYDTELPAQKCIYVKGIDSLRFRLMLPINKDSLIKYPLLLFFHGAGERGNDNVRQMNLISEYLKTETFKRQSAFVLLPQCPESQKWVDADWTQLTSTYKDIPERSMILTVNLIDKIISEYKIDTNRLYVMGLSMGGFGVWDIITRYPSKFAAAVPICGGGDEYQIVKTKNTAIWAFHGGMDVLVNVSRSKNMIDALEGVNLNIKYTEYKNVGHNAWDYVFKEEHLTEWLFMQSKFSK